MTKNNPLPVFFGRCRSGVLDDRVSVEGVAPIVRGKKESVLSRLLKVSSIEELIIMFDDGGLDKVLER